MAGPASTQERSLPFDHPLAPFEFASGPFAAGAVLLPPVGYGDLAFWTSYGKARHFQPKRPITPQATRRPFWRA